MMTVCYFFSLLVLFFCVNLSMSDKNCCDDKTEITAWQGSWRVFPTSAAWSLETHIPMTADFSDDTSRGERGKFKVKKKLKKFLLPLLIAYKLKFFTLIPVLIGGLVLLTGATGLAGFFFALFAAVMGLKTNGGHG